VSLGNRDEITRHIQNLGKRAAEQISHPGQ
jgi:hypothetical protein